MKTAPMNRKPLAVFQLGALVLVLLLAMLVTACAGGTTATATPGAGTPTVSGPKTFTAAQLAVFDGTNGNPAYIAIAGKVYDVSGVAQWTGGKPHGYKAGRDLTAAFPHPENLLATVPVVGTFVG
jgi:predicted heme/steroid binding protein